MGFVSAGRLRLPRAGLALAALLIVLLAPAKSHAQTFTWNQPTSGGAWGNAANWLPNSGTPNGASAIAIFGNVATGANTVNLPVGGVTIGELRFEDVNAGSLTAVYTIANGQSITFNNGAAPSQINVTGYTVANQTIASGIIIGNSQPLNITNNGAPGLTTLTISGGISALPVGSGLVVGGSSNTAISGAINGTVNTLTKNGSGTLTLSGVNGYTGGTIINGGTIRFTNNNQLGAGGVTLNGGALHVADDIFVSRNINLGVNGGTILSTVGSPTSQPTFLNPISGSGSITFDGGSYLQLTANNNYTGPTIINNVGLILGANGLAAPGQLSATSLIRINGYVGAQVGIFDIRKGLVASGGNQVNDGAAITLDGGVLNYFTELSGTVTETFGSLTTNGFGTVWGNNSGGAGTMAFGNLSRTGNFSTLYVGGPVDGASIRITFSGGITSPGGSGQTIGIIPWIGGDAGSGGVATGRASTLYTYNANGLLALDTTQTTHFTQVAAGEPLNGLFGDVTHNAIIGNPLAVNSPVTILSLVQNVSSTAPSSITGSSVITVSTGAIANANQLLFNGPTVNFGTATGYLWLGNVMGVLGSSSITGSGGVVVSSMSVDGQNELRLQNTGANTFTGGLYINGSARVRFNTADSQLGAAGEIISLRGGTLWYNGASSINLVTSGINRPLEMFAAGGGIVRVETAGVSLTVPGLISGSEQLTVTGAGTLVLSNTANTYAGGTTIGDATLAVAGPGSLGSGNVTFGAPILALSGGTLRFDSAGTYAFNINQAVGAATLNTNGNNVTLSGVISGNGTTLTKIGTGTLTLSGANTYTANTIVNAGRLLITNTSGLGAGYGTVTVATGASFGGTSTVGGSVTVNGTGRLIVGMPGGTGTLTLRGATALSGTGTYESRIAGTTAGTGYAQLVITSGGTINLAGVSLDAILGYVPVSTDKIFLIDNRNATGGLTGTFNGLAQGATYTFSDGTTAVISYTGVFGTGALTGGNDVVLHTFVPVPEPSTVLGIAALALGGLMWRSRREAATLAA